MRLALKNLLARKISTLKVLISLIIMVVIMCVFTSYSIALSGESSKVIGAYRAGHYLNATTDYSLSDEKLQDLHSIKGVGDIKRKGVYDHDGNLRNMQFSIDNYSFHCNHFVYDNEDNAGNNTNINLLHSGNIGFVDSNVDLISINEVLEHEYRWNDLSLVYAGAGRLKDNEIIVSEYFLSEFGLGADIVGKGLDISIGDGVNAQHFNDMIIVGILSSQYYELTGFNRENIITSFNSDLYKAVSKDVKYDTIVYIDDYMSVKNIGESMVSKGYFKIKAGSEYGLLMATTVTIISTVLTGVMATVGAGILGAIILNMVFSMRYMILKKADFYGIISAYGTKNQGIFNILFFEMFYIASIAGVLAYSLSYGIVFLLDYILSFMLGVGVIFSIANFLITFAVAFLFSLVVILGVTIVNYVAFTRKNTMKMLGRTLGS